MHIRNQTPFIRKTLYTIMLLGLFLSAFSAGNISSAALSTSLPSGYNLPFPIEETWYYTGGPHHYCGYGYLDCLNPQQNGRPWSSVDFAPPEGGACPLHGSATYLSNRWIVAAKGGTVVQSKQGLVVIDHNDGWQTYYSHVSTTDRRALGDVVNQGDRLGHPSCEVESGGTTEGIHVHFAIWHSGEGFVNITGLSLSGWQIQETSFYNGTMTRSGVIRTAETVHSNGTNNILNSGSGGSSPWATLNLTVKLENPQSLGNFNHSNQVAVVVLKPGTKQILFGPSIVSTNSSGYYGGLGLSGIQPGMYDICAKARYYLGQCARNITVSQGSTISIDFSNGGSTPAWLGDIDLYGEDNEDNALDLERIKFALIACLPNCGLEFDMNRDGVVNTQDYSLVLYRVGHDFRGEGAFNKPFGGVTGLASSEGSVSGMSGGSGTLSIQPDFQVYWVGDIINASIVVDTGGGSISGVDAVVYYDPGLLEVLDEDGGTAGVQISNAGLFPNVYRNMADSSQGVIKFSSGYGYNNSQFNGTGTLATLRFRVIAATPSMENTSIKPVVTSDVSDDSNGVQFNTALDVLTSSSSAFYILQGAPDRPAPSISLSPASGSVIGQNLLDVSATVSDPYNQVECVNFGIYPNSGNSVSSSDCDSSDGWSAQLDISGIPDQNGVKLRASVALHTTSASYTSESTNITLDRTPPEIASISFTPNTPSPGDSVRIDISVSDNFSLQAYTEVWINTANDGSENGDWVRVAAGSLSPPNPTLPALWWDTTNFSRGSHLLTVTVRDDTGNWRSWNTVRTIGTVPTAFTKSNPVNLAINQPLNLTLSWQPSAGEDGYEYCLEDAASNTTNDCDTSWNTPDTATSTSLSSLHLGTTYYWQVRAINTNGTTYANGSATAYNSFTTGNVPASFNKISPRNDATEQPLSGLRLRWAASNGVTPTASYEYCYNTTPTCDPVSWQRAGLYTSVELQGLKPLTTYYWQVRATNDLGVMYSNNNAWSSFTTVKLNTSVLYSTAVNDGWTLESSEFSNVASTKSNSGTLRVGDDARNRQYRSLLYFNTASLPNNAVITKVTVLIKKASLTGTDPFLTHGDLVADMKKGFFGLAPLELTDFKAAGEPINTAGKFVVTTDPSWYRLTLNPIHFKYVNLFGATQFRLRFTKDDDNDKTADFISFYSGNEADVSSRPVLSIEYYVP